MKPEGLRMIADFIAETKPEQRELLLFALISFFITDHGKGNDTDVVLKGLRMAFNKWANGEEWEK